MEDTLMEKDSLTINYTPPRVAIDVETILKLSVGRTMKTNKVKTTIDGVNVKLSGDWENVGVFADDIDTMKFDMEFALQKIIKKYIRFNSIFSPENPS